MPEESASSSRERLSASGNGRGVCIWFTGLSGSGKTTTADLLYRQLAGRGRTVTLLDGDVIRAHLSKELGFSKEDRDTNVRRVGFVASEIVRHHGIVVCALFSPYRSVREEVRELVGAGKFIEVHVDTSLDVCEGRDPKGLYARARRGEIRGFTGINDPYEIPLNPEITIDTVAETAQQNAARIVASLSARDIFQESGGGRE